MEQKEIMILWVGTLQCKTTDSLAKTVFDLIEYCTNVNIALTQMVWIGVIQHGLYPINNFPQNIIPWFDMCPSFLHRNLQYGSAASG